MNHIVFLQGLEGEAYGWNIDSGVTYAKGKAKDSFVSGYLNRSQLQEGAKITAPLTPLVLQRIQVFGIH